MTRNKKGQFAKEVKQNCVQYISWQQFIYTLLAVLTISVTIIITAIGSLSNSIKEADSRAIIAVEKANVQVEKLSADIKTFLYSLDKRLTRIEDKLG